MRILITGGAGSVGKELALKLVEQGNQVRVVDLPACDFGELEALPEVEIIRGDICERAVVNAAVEGMESVLHLAALLPQASERDENKTFAVNVGGTRRLVEAIQAGGSRARLVFSSSVATYGNTTDARPPLRVDHPQSAVDLYGKSKIAAERAIRASGIPFTILRISGIVIPALLEPPDPYPFMRDQRMEFVARADVVSALSTAIQRERAANRTLNIAGGSSWQMLGNEYVRRVFELLDISLKDAHYRETPWWSDWYDTEEAQTVLGFQHTPFPLYLEQLERAIREAIGF
jgi:nucleoside-diphosphate-sugar epimerase